MVMKKIDSSVSYFYSLSSDTYSHASPRAYGKDTHFCDEFSILLEFSDVQSKQTIFPIVLKWLTLILSYSNRRKLFSRTNIEREEFAKKPSSQKSIDSKNTDTKYIIWFQCTAFNSNRYSDKLLEAFTYARIYTYLQVNINRFDIFNAFFDFFAHHFCELTCVHFHFMHEMSASLFCAIIRMITWIVVWPIQFVIFIRPVFLFFFFHHVSFSSIFDRRNTVNIASEAPCESSNGSNSGGIHESSSRHNCVR